MILYTIVPMDAVMGNVMGNTLYETVEQDGGFIELTQSPEGGRINRVISTDPKMYLNPQYEIGGLFHKEQKKP